MTPALATRLVPLLRRLDPEAFKLGMGLLLVVFSAFLLLNRRPLNLRFGGRAADGAIGLAGGVLAMGVRCESE